jgi:hypothetical protein
MGKGKIYLFHIYGSHDFLSILDLGGCYGERADHISHWWVEVITI